MNYSETKDFRASCFIDKEFGDKAYRIIQHRCPNMTCCFDCHIDDFCHIEGCELDSEQDEENE